MSLWDKLKGELIDIVEFVDESQNTLVHRFNRMNNEIKNGAELIVRESQTAVFVREGTVADHFVPGHYQLTTKNIPILSTLMGWKHGFESPFKAEVYFVSTKLFTGRGWGTATPITLRDPEFVSVRIRANGTYNLQVVDPVKLVTSIAGTNSTFQVENIDDQLRTLVVSKFTDAVAELKIPMLDLATQFNELGTTIGEILNREFAELGFKIHQFTIGSISLPPELQEALDKRTARAMQGNLNEYSQYQAANAMENASKNDGEMGGMMGGGMGMGMGMAMANQMANAMNPQQGQGQPQGGGGAPPPIPGQSPYFIAVNGQQQGPFNMDQLKGMVQQGQLTRDTMVWKEGMANWARAGDQPDLQPVFGSVPPPPPPG